MQIGVVRRWGFGWWFRLEEIEAHGRDRRDWDSRNWSRWRSSAGDEAPPVKGSFFSTTFTSIQCYAVKYNTTTYTIAHDDPSWFSVEVMDLKAGYRRTKQPPVIRRHIRPCFLFLNVCLIIDLKFKTRNGRCNNIKYLENNVIVYNSPFKCDLMIILFSHNSKSSCLICSFIM